MNQRFRPTRLIRLALALGLILLMLFVLWGLLALMDTAFGVWEQLVNLPSWFLYLYGMAFLGVSGAGVWALWRLLGPRRRKRQRKTAPPDRKTIEKRLEQAEAKGMDLASVRKELALLQQRKAAGTIYVGFFGEISSGKSSLIQALLPQATLETDVLGGTTREITAYRWRSPGGDTLVLLDMPGTNEVGGALDEMARSEALRAHLVVYVCDGDLSRSQYEELQALLALNKPTIIALNKIDRYRQEELILIIQRLQARLGQRDRVRVVPVQAGGKREALVIGPDGREKRVVRTMPPRVDALREALQQQLDEDWEVLEKLRDTSVFVLVSQQLDAAEQAHRAQQMETLTKSYAKKAMVGALAAVAPGSDLVIQGYLSISMVKEMARLHGVHVRELDLDLLLQLAQKRVAKSTTIMLAVAGNALKAFPGVGTLLGGLTHAVAYGMIFEALGKAVAQSLSSRGALRPAQAAQVFEENLREDLEARARHFARLALEIHRADRERPETDTAAR